jgi:hypothetical protein
MDEILEAIRRRREAAMAEHNALMTALDDMETLALQASALREPPTAAPEPEPELTWGEIWQNHPAAEDFFRQFPDDRLPS